MTVAAAPMTPSVDDRLAKRNALVLAAAQSLGGSTAAIVIALGGLVGHALLGADKEFATLPVTTFVLGTAVGTLPAGYLARRFGRRIAFMGGTLGGTASGLLAAWAVFEQQFVLFCLASFCAGLVGAFVQQYRFAAADTASDAFKPKAISWVMAGGVLAGIVGPQTVIHTVDLFEPVLFAGSFLALAGLNLLAFVILSLIRIPVPARVTGGATGRPMREIMAQRRFIVAVACGIGSYALMSFVMTATPLAMVACGLTQTDATLAIQWHVLAMFGPSFFTGSLIARFGKERVVAAGLFLLVGCGIVALAGVAVENFWFALVLLGLGWNFGFIGSTAMVTDTYRPEERNRVQAVNDFLVFGFVALASFSSGTVLHLSGWATINWMLFPVVAFCLLLLVWLVWSEKRQTSL